ncbi:hypothetical protein LSAT2_022800 [Lamellibrachia satsuma]|nr:hypothetical protein LSAT2_022800 [Lamellibrachia satsuma]
MRSSYCFCFSCGRVSRIRHGNDKSDPFTAEAPKRPFLNGSTYNTRGNNASRRLRCGLSPTPCWGTSGTQTYDYSVGPLQLLLHDPMCRPLQLFHHNLSNYFFKTRCVDPGNYFFTNRCVDICNYFSTIRRVDPDTYYFNELDCYSVNYYRFYIYHCSAVRVPGCDREDSVARRLECRTLDREDSVARRLECRTGDREDSVAQRLECRTGDREDSVARWLECRTLDRLKPHGDIHSTHLKLISRISCIEGWKLSINGILLWKTLENANIKFLLTRRLNQDALENVFITTRGKERYHTNPDARQFRAAFCQVPVDSLMLRSDGANCEDDIDSFLLSLESLKIARVDDVLTTPTTQDQCHESVRGTRSTTPTTQDQCHESVRGTRSTTPTTQDQCHESKFAFSVTVMGNKQVIIREAGNELYKINEALTLKGDNEQCVMVSEQGALKGRSTAVVVDKRHAVNGNIVVPPFPERMEMAMFAMPKVKNGRKGGPPADRRRSSRVTRVPRRLVDAASDSSSSDTDDLGTVNQALRQQLQDVQRQLYEAQASNTQPRPPVAQSFTSVPTATASSPLQPAGLATAMPILHLPVTPVPTTQPGTSALDSQGTDLQALLASALQQMAGTTQLGTAQGESPMTPFLILGATLDPKIKATIWAHQYIDLGSLVPPH